MKKTFLKVYKFTFKYIFIYTVFFFFLGFMNDFEWIRKNFKEFINLLVWIYFYSVTIVACMVPTYLIRCLWLYYSFNKDNHQILEQEKWIIVLSVIFFLFELFVLSLGTGPLGGI